MVWCGVVWCGVVWCDVMWCWGSYGAMMCGPLGGGSWLSQRPSFVLSFLPSLLPSPPSFLYSSFPSFLPSLRPSVLPSFLRVKRGKTDTSAIATTHPGIMSINTNSTSTSTSTSTSSQHKYATNTRKTNIVSYKAASAYNNAQEARLCRAL